MAGELAEAEARLQEALRQLRWRSRSPSRSARTRLDLAAARPRPRRARQGGAAAGPGLPPFSDLEVPRYVERAERLARELAVLLPRDGGRAALAG